MVTRPHRQLQTIANHVMSSVGMNTISGHVVPEPELSLSQAWYSLFGSVPHDTRHAGRLVANVIAAHGVKFVFCLAGGHISPILAGCNQVGVRVIDTRHEVSAMFAADAVARLSGVCGVAIVTAGPGVTNTLTAVQNCALAQSPVVLVGGASPSLSAGRGALQDIRTFDVIKPIVKRAWRCEEVRSIVPAMRAAFQTAMSGTPGPVYVELPMDILYDPLLVLSTSGLIQSTKKGKLSSEERQAVIVPVTIKATPESYLASLSDEDTVYIETKSGQPWHVRTLLKMLHNNVFGGASLDPDSYGSGFSPLPIEIPAPTASQVEKVAGMLRVAKRPLMLVGAQAMLTSEVNGKKAGPDELNKALNDLGVPCFLGGMARGLLGVQHPLFMRQSRGNALKQADLIILVGVVVDFRLGYGQALPRGIPIVSINRSSADLKLNQGIFWKAAFTCQADSCHFIVDLAAKMHGSKPSLEWAQKLSENDAKVMQKNLNSSHNISVGRGRFEGKQLVNPIAACFAMDEVIPKENAIIVADGGDFVATAAYNLRPRQPLGWLDPGPFGTLGVGGGFALGAKLARPDREVWLIWGDGSCGYSVAEFDSCARHRAPIMAVVGNDACWSQIEREQIVMLNDDVACPLLYTNYEEVADGYGGKGFKVGANNDCSFEEVRRTLQMARDHMNEKEQPVLVNILIGKSSFREGSISA